MNVLGNYSIDITTKRTYASEGILSFFCSNNAVIPSLDAYFLNINPTERLEVEEQFFAAILNLSDFDVVHFIKANNKMTQIKNQGKAFVQANSNVKKIIGTIVKLNQNDAIELNSNTNKITRELFELEPLLNNFIKKQQQAAAAKIDLFLKLDVNLPKYIIGFDDNISTKLQAAFNEIISTKTALEEITLTVKLINRNNVDVTVSFALTYNNKETTFCNFETQIKTIKRNTGLNKGKGVITQAPMASIKILLAEDHKMSQKIGINLLKKEFKGVEIDVVENGLAAFEMAKKNNYDLVLMDIDLPILNGFEASEKIRKELKSDLPILAFSANVFQQQIQKCFMAGINDFIAKPVNVNSLRLKIKNALKYNAGRKKKKTILKNLYGNLDDANRVAI